MINHIAPSPSRSSLQDADIHHPLELLAIKIRTPSCREHDSLEKKNIQTAMTMSSSVASRATESLVWYDGGPVSPCDTTNVTVAA
jgi:hypothetical protein